MRRIFAAVLLLVALGVFAPRPASPEMEGDNLWKLRMKAQLKEFPLGSEVRVRLKDHRQISGELVARGEESFQLAGAPPQTIPIADVTRLAASPKNPDMDKGSSKNKRFRDFGIMAGASMLLLGTLFVVKR